jgi:hypothetical protein
MACNSLSRSSTDLIHRLIIHLQESDDDTYVLEHGLIVTKKVRGS